ncbi:MAG: AAA family ATPase [Planctomycetes bacterium]|nr:AAA family ATPase [Planctomycetota bacterium]
MMDEVRKSVIGQEECVVEILAAVFTHGHCLLIGVPGLAKTTLVKAIARAMALQFKRVQFTPDLMPSDITGTNILQEDAPGKRQFQFVEGPLFANIVLADEINRTPPKTQAALLEAMQERQVTVGNVTHPLPEPFFVIATQNPIEQEGTYPLPEAQLDRFMFTIDMSYPSAREEEEIYAFACGGAAAEPRPALTAKNVADIQAAVGQVAVARHVIAYAARIVRATRPASPEAPPFVKKTVEWGAGPRAGLYLIQGAKALAAMDGRPCVSCEDVRRIAVPVLKHRISTNFQAQMEGVNSVMLVRKLLQTVEEPKVPKFEAHAEVAGA